MSNVYWIGGAPPVRDVWTITVADTWASGDTAQVSIGNKDLIVALGGAASTLVADIAAEIADAINGLNNATPGTGFTWNYGGQEFLEFQEVAAEANGAVVTVTAVVGKTGVPIGLSVLATTAGDGTLAASNVTPATGPNFFDNADNWLDGALPVNSDVVYFDRGAVDCLYGLDYLRANTVSAVVIITGDWTGQLGLPPHNGVYAEYRDRYFEAYGSVTAAVQINPGTVNTGATKKRLWIDFSGSVFNCFVRDSRGSSSNEIGVFLAGSHASTGSNLYISALGVELEPSDASTASANHMLLTELEISPTTQTANGVVILGPNVDFDNAAAIKINGGLVRQRCSSTNVTGAVALNGGTLNLEGGIAFGDATIEAGATLAVYDSSDPQGAITVHGGVYDARGCTGPVSNGPTLLAAYAGSSIYDPNGYTVGVISLRGCTYAQLAAAQLPSNRLWDFSAAAT